MRQEVHFARPLYCVAFDPTRAGPVVSISAGTMPCAHEKTPPGWLAQAGFSFDDLVVVPVEREARRAAGHAAGRPDASSPEVTHSIHFAHGPRACSAADRGESMSTGFLPA